MRPPFSSVPAVFLWVALPIFLLLQASPEPASASGINLSWDECGSAGTDLKSFACDVNTGLPFHLYGSFVAPAEIHEFLGVSAELRINAPQLPDWWKHGNGFCRGSNGLSVSFEPGAGACRDLWQSQGVGGFLYEVGIYGSSSARLRIQAAVPFDLRGPLDAGTEYYAFRVNVSPIKSVAPAECSGCDVPVAIALDHIQLFQPPALANDPVLNSEIDRRSVTWQGDVSRYMILVDFNPKSGSPGTPVRIEGAGFTGVTSVSFGNTSASFQVENDTVIEATVPDGAGIGPITVTGDLGTVTSLDAFVAHSGEGAFSLDWDACGSGVTVKDFACDNIPGPAIRLIGSFIPPPGVERLAAVTSEIELSASNLPDWWRITPGCAVPVQASPALPVTGTCWSPWVRTPTTETQYTVEYYGPNTARILFRYSVPDGSARSVHAGQEYIAFRADVSRTRSNCAGCPDPVDFTLRRIRLDQVAGSDFNPEIVEARDHGVVHWRGLPGTRTRVLAFSPGAGPPGTVVAVSGENFTGATSVSFGGDVADFDVLSDSEIRATVPPLAHSGPIRVTAPLGTATSRTAFTAPPVVGYFNPRQGTPGTRVTIQGYNLREVLDVRFGNEAATFNIDSDNQLHAFVPSLASTGPIAVENVAGVTLSPGDFQVLPSPDAQPIVNGFDPGHGLPGSLVSIHGWRFTGATSVRFGAVPASFVVASDEHIQAVVPDGAVDGPITVETPAGAGTSTDVFRIAAPIVNEGPNLFLDPSFEESVREWRAVEGSIDRSAAARTGGYSMRALRGPMVRRFDLSDRPNHVQSVLEAGDVYRFTAWVKEVSGGVSVRLKIKEYLEGTHLQTATFAAQPLSRHWQRFAVEITSLSAGSSLDFQFVFEPTLPDAEVLIDDVSVRQQGSGPSLSAPAFVDALPGEPIEVVVTAADASGAPLVGLTADLFRLPMLNDATFTVDPDFSRGVLRWTPEPEDGAWEHPVTFRGRSVVEGVATTGIRVAEAAPDPRRVLIDFEARDSRWRGHRGATVEWTATGRSGSAGALVVRGPNPMSTFGANDYPNWVPYTGTQVGARFRYSCWVRAVSGEGRALLRINEYLLGVQVGGSTLSGKIPLTRDWQQIVVERLTEAAGTSLDVRIECEPTTPDAAFVVDDLTIRYPEGLVAAERFAASGTSVLERPVVFPNPVRDRATLSWSIAAAGPVRVGIFDVHGRRVRSVLHDPEAQPGTHHLLIDRHGDDGRRLQAGIYFCRIEASDGERKARFVILE